MEENYEFYESDRPRGVVVKAAQAYLREKEQKESRERFEAEIEKEVDESIARVFVFLAFVGGIAVLAFVLSVINNV